MEDLLRFLSVPLSDSGDIFDAFAALPNAVYCKGDSKLKRFVYVPGTRSDRVVLIAHADTVWDDAYLDKPCKTLFTVDEEHQLIRSAQEGAGIGADDRAGCAMLWKLRFSGHSLLLLDGEEHGHFGALLLQKHYPALLRQLNRHRYMLQLDLWGANYCMYHKIPNSKAFCAYIESSLSLEALDRKNGTDISYLCTSACGANISVGYLKFHTPAEVLSITAWQNMFQSLQAFLEKPQPKFRTVPLKRLRKWLAGLYRRALRIAKKILPGK